jgi:hypothetical protein
MQQRMSIDKITTQTSNGERVAKVQVSFRVEGDDQAQGNAEQLLRLQGQEVSVAVEASG